MAQSNVGGGSMAQGGMDALAGLASQQSSQSNAGGVGSTAGMGTQSLVGNYYTQFKVIRS